MQKKCKQVFALLVGLVNSTRAGAYKAEDTMVYSRSHKYCNFTRILKKCVCVLKAVVYLCHSITDVKDYY